jgi:PIN domain nuclease of toxin-antitoxin system
VTGYLCDTHVVLWAAVSPDRLDRKVREILEDGDLAVFVSSVSIAEMAIKRALGKLTLPSSPLEICQSLEFDELVLTWGHAAVVENLPAIHRDPFDRLLIAQAVAEDLTLITADSTIASYPDVRIQRC